MIKSISIKNFKSLNQAFAEIKPLTILLGKNSSGKSSFLQTFLLLKQTIQSREQSAHLILKGNYVDLGGYKNLVFRHKSNSDLEIKIVFENFDFKNAYQRGISSNQYFNFLKTENDFISPLLSTRNLELICTLRFFYDKIERASLIKEIEYKDPKGIITLHVTKNKTDDYRLVLNINSMKKNIQIALSRCRLIKFFNIYHKKDSTVSIKINGKRIEEYEKKYKELFYTTIWGIPILFNALGAELLKLGNRLLYLEPLREKPSRIYFYSGETKQDVGPKGEAAVELLNQRRDLKTHVKKWLKNYDIADLFSYRMFAERSAFLFKLRHPISKFSTGISDHGFGVSQILPIVLQGYLIEKNSILLLEAPEIHLHPKAQAEIADMLIELSKRGSTIITETHSDHLINRILRRVAENPEIKKSISILYFEMTPEGTKVQPLKISDGGQMEDWPDDFVEGFLDLGFHDAMAQANAITKSRKKNV